MACASSAMDDIEEQVSQSERRGEGDEAPLIKYYKATQLLPSPDPPLHELLKKDPGVWASVQICSGVLSFGLGVVFAVAFPIHSMFLTLFRVPIITGLLFLFAGLLCAQLYKNPRLLQVCLLSNIASLVVATVGAILLSQDLSRENSDLPNRVKIFLLCMTILDMGVSAVLIFLIHSEKLRQRKK